MLTRKIIGDWVWDYDNEDNHMKQELINGDGIDSGMKSFDIRCKKCLSSAVAIKFIEDKIRSGAFGLSGVLIAECTMCKSKGTLYSFSCVISRSLLKSKT